MLLVEPNPCESTDPDTPRFECQLWFRYDPGEGIRN